MRDLDDMIDAALESEEKDLLRAIGHEPNFFAQALGLFGGSLGWVTGLQMLIQSALFIGGLWATWSFFQAGDALTAIRWGLPAGVLLLMALIIKMSMWSTIQANRVIREIRRRELQAVRSARA